MRVAVIGAGCCGITAVKACLEEGLDVVCFERASDCGGLWWYRDETPESGTGTVMRFTVANTSKEMSCYSDFPPDKDDPLFMTHWQTLRYIRSYADHFGVTPKIRFNHEVLRLDKDGTVRVRDMKTGRDWEDAFDGVLVCTGHHGSPSVPDVPDRELFRGRVMHSRDYKYADETFKDKTVVVVGFANSALDVAVNLSTVARQVFLSTRRINWVLPSHYKSVPMDVYVLNQARLWLYSWLPHSWFSRFVIRVANDAWDHKALGMEADHDIMSQGLVVNQYIDGKLLDGTVKIRGPPLRFTERGLVMDYIEEEVDTVVFATGFTTGLPFPTDALTRDGERLLLYKMMIPPANPNVAFLGFVDGNANLLQVFEMQARYMARVFSGKLTLPSREAMEQDVAATQNTIKSFFVPTPRHSLMIDKIAYVEDLAKIIGAKPNYLKLLFTDPKLYYVLMTSPVLNYQYRLQGPHCWDKARDAILGFQERLRAPLRHRKNGEDGGRSTANNFTTSKLVALCAVVGVSVCLSNGTLKSAPHSLYVFWDRAAQRVLAFASSLGGPFGTAAET
uniref:Flavin-containing monooxygenase n=1 Tax=Amblyomma aureolatum TaxID=187763 RepID=A0A1E1XAK4_9ACAR